jgi:preprotein translocase subunit YajC
MGERGIEMINTLVSFLMIAGIFYFVIWVTKGMD